MSFKRVTESTKPKGLTYTYPCGHTHFMAQQEVRDYIYAEGPNAPETCPTCASSPTETQ